MKAAPLASEGEGREAGETSPHSQRTGEIAPVLDPN